MANLGNAVHTIYVVSLPVGPIWALHGFYLASTAVMFGWWLRYRDRGRSPSPPADSRSQETRLRRQAPGASPT